MQAGARAIRTERRLANVRPSRCLDSEPAECNRRTSCPHSLPVAACGSRPSRCRNRWHRYKPPTRNPSSPHGCQTRSAALGATGARGRHRHDDILFGIVLIALSVYLFLKGGKRKNNNSISQEGAIKKHLIDKHGNVYDYSYNLKWGIIISALVGFFSPLLGIGGGIIHVPAMVEWLHFPVHIATATSHFILAIMSLVSVVVHFFDGSYSDPKTLQLIGWMALGVIPGAFLGAKLSHLVKGTFIIKALAISLAIVGGRILISAIF